MLVSSQHSDNDGRRNSTPKGYYRLLHIRGNDEDEDDIKARYDEEFLRKEGRMQEDLPVANKEGEP